MDNVPGMPRRRPSLSAHRPRPSGEGAPSGVGPPSRWGDDDLGTPVAQEALEAEAEPAAEYIAPNESTTMIQAMPDDEPPARETDTVRRSRKSSKKRRG